MEEIAAVIDGWNHARWGVVIGGASRFFNGFKNLQQPGLMPDSVGIANCDQLCRCVSEMATKVIL